LHLKVETQSFRRQLGTARGFPLEASSAHWHTFRRSKERPERPGCPKTDAAILHAEAPRLRIAQSGCLHVHWSRARFSPKHWTRTSAHPASRSSPPISTHHTPDSFILATITPFSLSFSFQSGKKVPLSSSYIFHTSHRPAQTPCPLLSVICISTSNTFHVLSYPRLKPVIVTALIPSLRYGNDLLVGPCEEGRG
jgi:hypothetical protein